MKIHQESLLELCQYLLPEDPTLEQEVRLSIENPDTFLSQIKYILRDWIENEPITEEIPLYTLIHGLYQRGLIFELTARRSAETMELSTNQLFTELQAHQSPPGIYPLKDSMHFVDAMLAMTGHYFIQNDYMLAEIRLPSDTSVITLIPQDVADKCSELMQRSGYGDLSLYPSTCTTQMDLPRKDTLCEMLVRANSLPV